MFILPIYWIFSSKVKRDASRICCFDLLLSFLIAIRVYSGMSIRVYYEAPGNVLHDAPDEALVMNVESDEIEPSIELLEISYFNSFRL